ncbi:dermonecrotic toxin domain-containing protein [Pseudomonas typographi]|uniref:dermonecrotic toxin domain-containing protein n=1 Tax=Pseudomonas typographi TaxID=2715964 RepID=UPI00168617E9|nr:DUF6543 domain-containing protein [Pseudomonas typographi]MBD1553926.1 mannosyltransferase [Pseudomonas typographi]
MTPTHLNRTGTQTVRNALTGFPRPDRAAADAVRAWAHSQGIELNPDLIEAVTLHYQFHDGQWFAKVAQRLTLTQALLSNWQGESANDALGGLFGAPWAGNPPPGNFTLVDELPYRKSFTDLENGAEYAVYNGLYRTATPAAYNTHNHVALPAEAFQAFIWRLDFQAPYKAMLDTYWASQLHGYGLAAKIAFVAACNKQVVEGSLSSAGRRLAWQVAGLEAAPSWESLGKPARAYPVVLAAPLNIYGYTATDLLCLFDNQSGTTLLYIPGNASPLHEFANHRKMQAWVAEQCKGEHTRQALKAHFDLADGPDGLSYSGLDTAMAGLAAYPHPHHLPPQHEGFATSGVWSPYLFVNYKVKKYSPLINGDLGGALAFRQQQRSYRDADFIIASDASVTKAKWRGYLNSAINLLGPLALAVPELAPLLAAGGLAQFGLGLDHAIHGKNAHEQAEGVQSTAFGLLNALPLVHSAAANLGEVYTAERSGFFSPRWVNGRWGYPLSPVDPPQLPADPLAAAFEATDAVAVLPEPNAAVARSVTRIARWTGERDILESFIDSRTADMVYDLERDAFLRAEAVNEVAPTYYVAPDSWNPSLVPEPQPPRVATHASRMSTLRALGVDLTLPVDLAGPLAAARSEIPHSVMSIWVGDKVLSSTLLESVAHNAQALDQANYRFRLFLSNANTEAYRQNLQLLAQHAPTLEVITLEEHPFYAHFAQSDNFAQYRAAIDGNGGVATNYSSASDVLRYPLLHHEGGIYMDLDDQILPPGAPTGPYGGARPLSDMALAATPDGLLLNDTVSNYKLGMRELYNTSVIGSHAGNPTLEAISEEMHLRYQTAQDFYNTRPSPTRDPAGFRAYAARLSELTGPALLNDVITHQRPELRQLRGVLSLWSFPVTNQQAIIDFTPLGGAINAHLPFSRCIKIGGTQSWVST